MKCLVTGALGFIGSNLADELITQGHTVLGVDDLSTGNIDYKNDNVSYTIASITDVEKMIEISKGVDVIFHEAAWARVQRSVNDPYGTHNVNVTGTITMLEAARVNNVRRFIFASSSSVYGDQLSPVMKEHMLPNPLHPYALQKYIGELSCEMYSSLYGMSTTCLRYFNVYGPRQILSGDYALVIGKFMQQKALGKKMTIYGDGSQTRAYTHVFDVVRANILAMYRNDTPTYKKHAIFNVGTGIETSVNTIAMLLGGEAEYITPNPRGKFEEDRKCADYSRISRVLGWEPSITIKEGIDMLLKNS